MISASYTGKDLDRLIQALYRMSVEEDWLLFRAIALEALCNWLGAAGAVWMTGSRDDPSAEFTAWPSNGWPISAESALSQLELPPDERDASLKQLPSGLTTAETRSHCGFLLSYIHRGEGLRSRVLLRFDTGNKLTPDADWLRAVGHMVEAAGLSLRQFIQRDEWLYSLGRPNRGTAALVDSRGFVYAASRRFREYAEMCGPLDEEFTRLPFELPADVVQSDGDSFFSGPLHFRVARHGHLFLLHARRPLPLDGLSPREQQIARALGNGKTFKSVARQYDIAVSTVANHASRIYRKLGVFRREDLVELVREPAARK